MGERKAGIKLTLDGAGFSSGLAGLEGQSKRTAKGIGAAFKGALSDGLKGGMDALKGAMSTIKSAVTSIGGIAGGIGMADLLRSAVTTERGFRDLAFRVRAGTGELMNYRDIQREVQRVALDTAQSTEDLGAVMSDVFQETGDAEFARNTIGTIGTAATGAHEPLETMGAIAGTLNEKFGILEENLGDTLAATVSLGNKGGISMADMGEKLGQIGAFAKEAGLQGEEGFSKVVALMNLADNATGSLKKGIASVGGILETLSNTSERAKIGAKLGIDAGALKGDATQQIGAILKATGGQKSKLETVFGGEQLRLLVDIGKTYAQAFAETQGDVKSKTAAALDAYQASLNEAGRSQLTFADLQAEAAKEIATPEKQLALSLEKLRQAFTKPEIIGAIDKLAASLPGLADVVADVVGFAAKSPVTAGVLGGAAVFGQGALGSGLSSLGGGLVSALGMGGKVAAGSVEGGMVAGAKQAAPLISGAGAGIAQFIVGGLAAAGVGYALGTMAKEASNRAKEKELQEIDTTAKGQKLAAYESAEIANATNDEFMSYTRNEKTGQLETKKSSVRRARDVGAFEQMLAGLQEQGLAPPMSIAAPGVEGAFRAPMALPGGRGAGVQAPQRSGAEDARLFADMMAGKELKVRLMNPEAIRGAGGSTTPPPGTAPRKGS